jgi:hypothetical protein
MSALHQMLLDDQTKGSEMNRRSRHMENKEMHSRVLINKHDPLGICEHGNEPNVSLKGEIICNKLRGH